MVYKKHVFIRGILVMSCSVFLVSLLSFLLMRLSPIDPAVAYVMRSSAIVTTDQIEEARLLLGMDQPLWVQYGRWLMDLSKGDLGISLSTGQPVIKEIVSALPVSLIVVGLSSGIMAMGSILLGMLQYLLRHRWSGTIIRLLSVVGIALPPFYIGILLLNKVMLTSTAFSIASNTGIMRYLPSSLCLSIAGMSFYGQLLGSRLEDEMEKPYIYFARCRGLTDLKLILNHALPSGIIDLVPSFTQMIGLVVAGAVVVERIFSLPGFGHIIIDSVIQRDAPMIHATVLVLAIILVLLNFIAEMIQYVFDPNRYSIGGGGS